MNDFEQMPEILQAKWTEMQRIWGEMQTIIADLQAAKYAGDGASGAVDLVTDLQTALGENTLEAKWNSIFETWAELDGTKTKIKEARRWIERTRDQFLDAVLVIDDPEDRAMTTALKYIELKCYWLTINTQLNYQIFAKGAPDITLQFRNSLISELIGSIEPFLKTDDINRIGEFVMDPLNQFADEF